MILVALMAYIMHYAAEHESYANYTLSQAEGGFRFGALRQPTSVSFPERVELRVCSVRQAAVRNLVCFPADDGELSPTGCLHVHD